MTVVGTKVDLCDEGKREVSTESGEKLAAALGDSFDRPLRPETRLPKKAKARGEPPSPVNPGPDIAFVETSAKLNKNIEGVSHSESIESVLFVILTYVETCTGFPRHRSED